MTVPSSLVVMVPSPSLSKSEKASLNSVGGVSARRHGPGLFRGECARVRERELGSGGAAIVEEDSSTAQSRKRGVEEALDATRVPRLHGSHQTRKSPVHGSPPEMIRPPNRIKAVTTRIAIAWLWTHRRFALHERNGHVSTIALSLILATLRKYSPVASRTLGLQVNGASAFAPRPDTKGAAVRCSGPWRGRHTYQCFSHDVSVCLEGRGYTVVRRGCSCRVEEAGAGMR
jgi:hypothetical protein